MLMHGHSIYYLHNSNIKIYFYQRSSMAFSRQWIGSTNETHCVVATKRRYNLKKKNQHARLEFNLYTFVHVYQSNFVVTCIFLVFVFVLFLFLLFFSYFCVFRVDNYILMLVIKYLSLRRLYSSVSKSRIAGTIYYQYDSLTQPFPYFIQI